MPKAPSAWTGRRCPQGTLGVDGKKVAEGRIERTISIRFSADDTFDVGEDTGTSVVDDYDEKMPFKFTGKPGPALTKSLLR